MEIPKLQQSKLFKYTSVDIRDEFEEKYERAYQSLQQKIFGLNDQELHDLLSGLICKDKQHEDVSMGLIYQILVEPTLAQKTYRDLTFLTRDGLMYVTTNLSILVVEKYLKLKDIPKRQLIWLLRELVKNQVLNVDNIVWNSLRQASGGDVSPKNLLLIENLLDILIEHRPWLDKYPFLVGAVVYTYVRLIEDHNSPTLAELRNKEVQFVIALIRDRFHDVIPLGRDFVRLLQNVARIPEFEQLWRDILMNPKSLLPTFTGVWQLLQIRTSRRFLQCRLTPEVERKLHFITGSVKFGVHKRYQDWFQDKYFSTLESHSLRSDLIRFIINAIHPTNDMLCSDLIPRWAIIGWLLASCTNPIALANAKLALFYDWLFFDPIKDNIMNIEPGILVMYHSIRNHPMVSSTLLDFLCRIMKNFYPIHEDLIRNGIYNSFRKILEKQVIPNLYPLFESPKLDRELKLSIREHFREFCGTSTTTTTTTILPNMDINNVNNNNNLLMMSDSIMNSNQYHNNNFDEQNIHRLSNQMMGGGGGGGGLQQNNFLPNDTDNNNGIVTRNVSTGTPPQSIAEGNLIDSILNNNNNNTIASIVIPNTAAAPAATPDDDEMGEHELEAQFSEEEDEKLKNLVKNEETDDDDDIPLSKVRLKEKPVMEKVELPASLNDSFEICLAEKTAVTFDTFLSDYRTANASLDDEQETYLHKQLVHVIKKTLPIISTLFPESKSDDKSLAESINYPIFSIFKVIYQYEDKCKKCLQHLLKQLLTKLQMEFEQHQQIGYLLLYFLKIYTKMQSRKNVNSTVNYKTNVYKIYCDHLDCKVEWNLARDLCQLEKDCSQIFLWLLPDIFREFKQTMINNCDVLRILCGCVDAKNLRDIIYSVTQGKLILLKNDGIIDCVRHSLNYETFEQYCLWQLVQAHDVPLEFLQDILPELESSNHAEAITYMLLMLKNEKPTTELVRLLLSRETKGRSDQFVTSSLRYWCKHSEETLSELIANLLTSKYPNSSPNKRKRPSKSSSTQNSTPSSDQLLSHLEYFRRSCRHGNGTGTGLYVQDAMQRALQQAFGHSSDSTKKQYSDLFALAAEDDTSGVGRRGTGGRGRKAPQNNKGQNSSNSNSKKSTEPLNYSTDEESSEDDWSKPKSSKRRKKAATISDSD